MHTTIPFGGGGAGGESAECTAVAADILAGKTAIHKESNDEVGEGTMTNVAATEAAKSAVLSSGVLYERMTHGAHVTNASSGYPEVSLPQATLASVIGLTADIIKKGESILGITGTFEGMAATDYGDTPDLLALGMIASIQSFSSSSTSTGTISTSYTRTASLTAKAGRRTWPEDSSNSARAGMVWERSSKLDTTGYPYMSCEFYVTPRSGRSVDGETKYFTPFIDWLTKDSSTVSNAVSANHYTTSLAIPEVAYGETPSTPLRVLFDISAIQERKARLFFGGLLSTAGSSDVSGLYLYTRNIKLYKEKPSGTFDVTVTYK